MKVCIISAYNEAFSTISNITFKSIEVFCQKHSFFCKRFIIPNNFDRPCAWFKIKCLKEVLSLDMYDYVLWIDADAGIVNNSFDLKRIFLTNKDIYVAKDFNNFNSGVVAFKNSAFSLEILNSIYNSVNFLNHQWWEQAAFIDLYEKNHQNIQNNTDIIDQNIWNAYDYNFFGFSSSHSGHVHDQTFIFHCPALPLETRIELLKNRLNYEI